MRILGANDIRAAITMREAIDAVREGFMALSSGRARVPLRNALQTTTGTTLFMPAYLENTPFSAVKVVSIYPQNERYGLPTIQATVLVLDAETGQPRAMLDGTYLTALRTGAATGLATELMAKPDAAILGLIGAGGQARTQIEGVLAVRPIREVRIYCRRGAQSFVNAIQESITHVYPNVTLRAASTPMEALSGADVLVAATTSSTPVILDEHVAPGVHINGVGSYTPAMQEVAADIVTKARIVVDSRDSCFAEAGDILIPIEAGLMGADAVYAEIGEVAAGIKPGRVRADEITFFKSVGTAVQDVTAAARVVANAEAQNLGIVVNF
jgi:ornithine cyclodeaminase